AALAALAAELPAGPGRGQVKLLKRLPWRGPPVELRGESVPAAAAAAAASEPAPREAPPTHVVYQGVAYRVGAEGIVVGRAPVDGRRTIVVGEDANGVSREHCEIVLRD